MHAMCAAGDIVTTSAAASDSNAVSSPNATTSADAATMGAASTSMPDAVTNLPADRTQDSTLQAPRDAAPISSDPSATAAGSLIAGNQPIVSAEVLSTAVADSATCDQGADWAPSPPLIPAVRRIAPRPSALFRHSISAMPYAAHFGHSKHQNAPALNGQRESAIDLAHAKINGTVQNQTVSASASEDDAEGWCSNSRQRSVCLKRPATAGQARSQTALHQVLGERSLRPQTAAAAGRAWPPVRYTVVGPNCMSQTCKL